MFSIEYKPCTSLLNFQKSDKFSLEQLPQTVQQYSRTGFMIVFKVTFYNELLNVPLPFLRDKF